MNDMVVGHPLAQIAGQKHRRLAVQVDKTCSHAHPSPAVPICSNYFKISSLPKPDRLLANLRYEETVLRQTWPVAGRIAAGFPVPILPEAVFGCVCASASGAGQLVA